MSKLSQKMQKMQETPFEYLVFSGGGAKGAIYSGVYEGLTDANIVAEFDHVLPPIDLMEHYEEMYPGTLSKLIAMAEKEQAHKHKMNIKSIEVYEEVTKKGRISAIIFIMMVCLSVIILSLLGHVIIASVFSSSVFLGIGIGSFLSSMKFARKKDYIRKQN